MKKLFFTLCALYLCGTMWGANATQDANRPETVYLDGTSGLYFYVVEEEAVITSVNAWTDESTNADFTSGYNINGVLTIPESVSYDGQNYNVTKIGASAFAGDTTIQGAFTIPSYINTVGASAFSGCTGITSVTIEYSETTLSDENSEAWYGLFYNCSGITEVTLNRNYSNAGNHNGGGAAFSYLDNIAEVIIGENVTSIPSYMFRANNSNGGALTTVVCYAAEPPTIDNSVFERHNSTTFKLYVGYEYVNVYKADTEWASVFGKDNIHSITGTDPDPEVDESAFQYNGLWYEPIEGTINCEIIAAQGDDAYTGVISIPATAINESTGEIYNVTRIDAHAFEGSTIQGEVVIPANILNVGECAFQNCTLITTVTYEYSDVELYDESSGNNTGSESFNGCSGVTTVNLYRDITPGSTSNLCTPFCYNTSVTKVNIGPRVTSIPQYMFYTNKASILATINVYSLNPPTFSTNRSPFGNGLSTDYVVNVPVDTESTYLTNSSWSTVYTGTHQGTLSDAFAITTHANDDNTAYATFYNSLSNVELFDGTLTAYEATTLEEDGLVIDIVEIGNVIPASTGVVVETASAGTYLAIANGDETKYTEENHLYGETDEDGYTIAPGTGNYLYYLLSSNESGQVGFYWGNTGGTAFLCQAHRAYLALEQGSSSQGISIRKGSGEDTTGISSVENATEGASVKGIYTIQGVRVSNMNQPGLYIVDGKKVLKR